MSDPRLARLAQEARVIQLGGFSGAAFLLDNVDAVEAIWGYPERCLWAKGEPLYIFAPPGLGKTTLAQQLALRRTGIRTSPLLEFPVEVEAGRLLYIAADRPRQAARSWRRMVDEEDREALALSVIVWPDAPPFMLSSQPDEFLPWVQNFGDISTVIVDSLFNLAPRLTDEEGAANTNNALQTLVRDGIEVVVIHHDRKRDAESRGRVHMDTMYGGRALTGGAGSIIFLDGEPGAACCKLRHLKQPSGRVGPLELRQDFFRGETRIADPEFPSKAL